MGDALGLRQPRTNAQRRILTVALDLFADHGVSATSLQMIADTIGVTKAAVYHQFKTKNEIVLAVAHENLAGLEDVLLEAEALNSPARAKQLLIEKVVELGVERRRWVHALQNDPVMVRFLSEDPQLTQLMGRVYGLLLDTDSDPGSRIAVALISSAIAVALVHPLVADLDDETLKRELLIVARRLFRVR